MKILFISDIHGIAKNIEKIESIIQKEQPNKMIVLGDIFGYSINKNEKIHKFLKKYHQKLICMKGNCDRNIFNDIYLNDGLKTLTVDNITIYLNHGHQYSYKKRQNFINKKGVLIYGHEHIPYIKKENDMVYVCVGSLSEPRNNSDESYLIYNNRQFILYDIDQNILDYLKI